MSEEFKCGTFEPRAMEEIAEIVNRPHHVKCPCGWCNSKRAEAEANELRTELAGLRARVKEYLAARDRSGGLDPLGGDEVEWIAACKATDLAEAALRAEVEK